MPKVTIINSETGESKDYRVGYGANLRKSALFQDVDIYKGLDTHLNCRGMGLCGKCVIEPVLAGGGNSSAGMPDSCRR